MEVKAEIQKFKKEFASLKTDEEKAKFDVRFKEFIASQSKEGKKNLADAFAESAKEEVKRAKEIIDYVDIRLKLEKISGIVSMAYISENYFSKSRSWFNQRLNNNTVNGVPVSFNREELQLLSYALDDIGTKMKDTARSIAC